MLFSTQAPSKEAIQLSNVRLIVIPEFLTMHHSSCIHSFIQPQLNPRFRQHHYVALVAGVNLVIFQLLLCSLSSFLIPTSDTRQLIETFAHTNA